MSNSVNSIKHFLIRRSIPFFATLRMLWFISTRVINPRTRLPSPTPTRKIPPETSVYFPITNTSLLLKQTMGNTKQWAKFIARGSSPWERGGLCHLQRYSY